MRGLIVIIIQFPYIETFRVAALAGNGHKTPRTYAPRNKTPLTKAPSPGQGDLAFNSSRQQKVEIYQR